MRRRHWRLYFWLLIGSYCWQACVLLPQRSLGPSHSLIQPLDFKHLALSTNIRYYEAGKLQRRAYIKLRLQKNHGIWFSVLGPWGIEFLRGMITPVGITLLNHVHKTYHYYDYATLQTLWPGPWDYGLVQSVLLGELAQPYKPNELMKKSEEKIVVKQQKGVWILNHLLNKTLGRLEKLSAKGPQGAFTATYQQFKAYQQGMLFREAAFSWHDGINPTMTLELVKLTPKWSETPLKLPFIIPAAYEKR